MAYGSSSRRNPIHSGVMPSVPADRAVPMETDLATWLTEWQNAFVAQGAGPLSADLALDLVLNKIVELAQESTHATAAAIALMREGEMICRAATGDGAPDLGTRLSSDTGLSAACVQTGHWQRCDDSESDPRVDAELCRRLGVRCMLVVPVLKEGRVLGVLEVFSAQAHAFGEPELQILMRLTRSIVENVDRAASLPVGAPAAATTKEAKPREESAAAGETAVLPAATSGAAAQTADFWTGALMIAVVALALTLGWMIGRAARQKDGALGSAGRRIQSQAAVQQAPTEAASETEPGGELEVYQNGKLVFPQQLQPAKARVEVPASPSGIQIAAAKTEIPAAGPVRIQPEAAMRLVTQRIEPEYPDAARERRVQGAVDMDAVIGKDGVVEKFIAIRGDPDLAAAASAAVRQWRFRPQPEPFETRITVVFRLP